MELHDTSQFIEKTGDRCLYTAENIVSQHLVFPEEYEGEWKSDEKGSDGR